jgi:8-oxo-dGTP pyrophosphatase MutT (NUDIX family)
MQKIYKPPEPPDELMRLFDENDNEVEPQTRQWIWDNQSNLRHAIGSVWIVNSKGQILCSKRSTALRGNPGKWETYFGGKVPVGSTCRETAIRELEEEAGIIIDPEKLLPIEEGKRISRFLYFYDCDESTFHSPDGEVTEARWLTIEDYHKEEQEHPEWWCNGIKPQQEKEIRELIGLRSKRSLLK